MRKGSFLPLYRCSTCGYHWGRGGSMRDCPKCGKLGPHRCCRLGWNGKVQGFDLVLRDATGGMVQKLDAQGWSHE
jgi:hypothetical protein